MLLWGGGTPSSEISPKTEFPKTASLPRAPPRHAWSRPVGRPRPQLRLVGRRSAQRHEGLSRRARPRPGPLRGRVTRRHPWGRFRRPLARTFQDYDVMFDPARDLSSDPENVRARLRKLGDRTRQARLRWVVKASIVRGGGGLAGTSRAHLDLVIGE